MALSGIELLDDAHRLGSFNCSKAALDAWLAGFARTNQARGFTRVQIVHDQDAVVGYYSLAPGVIQPNSAPRAIRTGRRPPQGFIPARDNPSSIARTTTARPATMSAPATQRCSAS
ncbi:hypothetical protein NKI54_33270 [Mesorhizobium sp. M0663]|uniref:hypothetical protein n=1 Tax=Mesorhizobium sp. M0663 TaxID=2956981 RepID=UPI00333C684B